MTKEEMVKYLLHELGAFRYARSKMISPMSQAQDGYDEADMLYNYVFDVCRDFGIIDRDGEVI